MALLTVEGVYRDGKVELSETPCEVADTARVLVTFLPGESEQGRAHEEAAAAEKEERRAAGKRLLARFEAGINFGGPPYPKRDELYDRNDPHGQKDG